MFLLVVYGVILNKFCKSENGLWDAKYNWNWITPWLWAKYTCKLCNDNYGSCVHIFHSRTLLMQLHVTFIHMIWVLSHESFCFFFILTVKSANYCPLLFLFQDSTGLNNAQFSSQDLHPPDSIHLLNALHQRINLPVFIFDSSIFVVVVKLWQLR